MTVSGAQQTSGMYSRGITRRGCLCVVLQLVVVAAEAWVVCHQPPMKVSRPHNTVPAVKPITDPYTSSYLCGTLLLAAGTTA